MILQWDCMELTQSYRITAVVNGTSIPYSGTSTGNRLTAIEECNQVLATTPYLSMVHAWIVSPVMTPVEPWVSVGPHVPAPDSVLRRCRVCDGPMVGIAFEVALRNMQQNVCGETCRATELKQHFACCEQAVPIACGCAYAFDCTKHGQTHVGSHD